MKQLSKLASLTALAFAGAVGCNDFLTGGEAGNDPNRPTTATNRQRFVGVQSNIYAYLASDPARIASVYAGYFGGTTGQYQLVNDYDVSEQTTNGFNAGLYGGGGLVDVRALQASTAEARDSVFLGIAQVQEAILVGTGADLFGDIVYTQALKNTPNPALDEQLAVYDSVQALLDRAIVNLREGTRGPTNVGPGSADLAYGGNAGKWRRLAYTLKARFYLHTAEVRPAAYAQALAAARLGITAAADDFKAVFSGASGEQNFFYQFFEVERSGYLVPSASFINLLTTRNDPRLSTYFTADRSTLSDSLLAPGRAQPLVTAQENLLIWAEAAYRGGNEAEALTQLNAARAIARAQVQAQLGAAAAARIAPITAAGLPLLGEILTEKYIALFLSIEPYNDYKRTCFPNLTPNVAGRKIPARLLYDTSERQTNTSIVAPSAQPARNDNDPANARDPFGNVCLGQ